MIKNLVEKMSELLIDPVFTPANVRLPEFNAHHRGDECPAHALCVLHDESPTSTSTTITHPQPHRTME